MARNDGISTISGPEERSALTPPALAQPGHTARSAPYRLDFVRLGIPVTGGVTELTEAHAHNRDYLLGTSRAAGELCAPKARSAYLRVLRRCLTAIGVDPRHMQLHVVTDDAPNAWWIHGTGAICVTTGMLHKPDLTEGELAHVLGHELGHYLKFRVTTVPTRFKNPLFRQAVMATLAAGRQMEEYQADALGLLITDAAGYSVDEAVNMERWRAGGTSADDPTAARSTTRVLDARHGSHPPHHARLAQVLAARDDRRFCWRNRQVAARVLPLSPTQLTLHARDRTQFEPQVTDPLAEDAIARIAQHPRSQDGILTASTMVCRLYEFLRNQPIVADARTLAALQRLRRRIEAGDLVAHGYYQALLTALYFDALRSGRAQAADRLAWLAQGDITNAEVLVALLAYTESAATTVGHKAIASTTFSLATVITTFPHSALRDHYIGALLRHPGLIKNRQDFIETYLMEHRPRLPFNVAVLTDAGIKQLLPLLHGTAIIDVNEILEGVLLEVEKPGEFRDIDHTPDESLANLLTYIAETAGPYPRHLLEYALNQNLYVEMGWEPLYDEQLSRYQYFYRAMLAASLKFRTPFLRERVAGAGRIVFARLVESIPAREWDAKTVAMIVSMPPSSERNHLLLLLDRAGQRAVRADELIFHEIPAPDAAGNASGRATLLDAFGFMDPSEGEAVYPTGQRMVDRYRADQLPATGDLELAAVLAAIPRPSPIRDELLDRCAASQASEAGVLLDAYWSPPAAYAKAFAFAQQWLESSHGDEYVLSEIVHITQEFPSLQRRMVTAWADRFGVTRETYADLLHASDAADVVDLYRGTAVEQSHAASHTIKATMCIASFASALARGDFAFLSLHDVEIPHQQFERYRRASTEKDRRDEQRLTEYAIFADYHPFLPENAGNLVALLDRSRRLELHRIPIVDGQPVPNPRFRRATGVVEGVAALKRWDGAKAFARFMQAMGWEEAVSFYEELLLGTHGVLQNTELFAAMERLCVEGIGMLLVVNGVPLARVANVCEGLRGLLAQQPEELRGRIWARILAGIAQQQALGEIVREAARPLGAAAGGKLMQAVHSLTVGVDATLEEATRLALDANARFTLFDALQFLGARGIDPFARHARYRLLGQGSVRTGIAGLGGAMDDSAYLLVHAGPADPRVVQGIERFIQDLTAHGTYFPLTASQFLALVDHTEEERLAGFANHDRFAALHQGQLGAVHIPALRETHEDWARFELVDGRPYSALSPAERHAVAPLVVGAALAQFGRPMATGELLINPETHAGNVLVDEDGQVSLVDCGLLGHARVDDVTALIHLYGGYAQRGLAGATATLLHHYGVTALESIAAPQRTELLAGLDTLDHQLRTGTAPELLLAGLASLVARSAQRAVTPGLDLLFRGLQHLVPYVRDAGEMPSFLTAVPTALPDAIAAMATAIDTARHGDMSDATAALRARSIPRGLGVGKALPNGSIHTLGILTADVDPTQPESTGVVKGLVACMAEGTRHYVRPAALRIQVEGPQGPEWITVAAYVARRRSGS